MILDTHIKMQHTMVIICHMNNTLHKGNKQLNEDLMFIAVDTNFLYIYC